MARHKSNDDVKRPYEEWLSNKTVTDKLKVLIEKVGFPLEVMTRNALEKREYYINSDRYYEQVNAATRETTLREIDIFGTKEFYLRLPECEITFNLNIVAECKYSSTSDFFVFESHVKSLYWDFPILFTLRNLLLPTSKSTPFAEYFRFPMIAQNIAAADVKSLSFYPEDKTIFDASTQLANALAYLSRSVNESHAELYADEEEEGQFMPDYENAIRELNNMYQNSVADEEYSRYKKKVTSELLHRLIMYWVPIWVPIVVLGKNNALLKVIMNEGEILDFKDMGYCIYPFTPSKVPDYFRKKHIARTEIPIVICNMNYLDRCIEEIETSVEKVIEDIKQAIASDPFKVCQQAYEEYQNTKSKKRNFWS